ncbi:hypothetical protein OH786_32115 [Streptomyces atratus]|uniref:Uncharacterized protein n=1 Tax=Streptomyces atratus TaxID=1893 RepID=A0A1K2EXK5_STRAR|nr:hypothetical protein [Streptomyces atratus]SFY40297.1 hypothetical protein SAMN02787144_102516 [Streptomyces atratus]
MTARLMRDLPALVGFVATVRERHPTTPFALMSTIIAPDRETVPGPSGPTVRGCLTRTREAVGLLRRHGDTWERPCCSSRTTCR